MYWLNKFGATVFPTALAEDDLGGQAHQAFVDLPEGAVFDALGSERALFSRKTVSMRRLVTTQNDYETLRGLVGKRDQLWRQADDTTLHWTYARCTRVDSGRVVENYNYVELSLHFEIMGRSWFGETQQSVTGTWSSGSHNLTPNNQGNAPVLPIVEFSNGANNSAQITGNGADWTYDPAPAGATIVIDCAALSVKQGSTDKYNNFTINSPHALDGWLILDPGSNTITITQGAGNLQTTIKWYDAYI